MSTQGASLSSSSSSRQWKNDVYLSFKGDDTRFGFTDHLYTALRREGILTFLDPERLEREDSISSELVKLIEESRLAIVIFSERYAFSRWCLDELKEIAHCMREMEMTVLPIFYNVSPSDIRKQSGSFGIALSNHEIFSKNSIEKVQSWRAALTEIASLSGWHVEGRRESEVINEIVKVTSDKLKYAYPKEKPLRDQAYIAKMVKEKDLDSLRKFGRTQIMAMALGIDSEKEILGHEQVLHSQRILSAIQTSALGFFQFLPKSFYNYTILLLFVGAVLSLGFGLKEEGLSTGWYEGVIIIIAIIILVVVDTLHEFRLDHSQLMSGKRNLWGRQRMMVDVFIRGGFQKVNIYDVLIGDMVRLKKDYTVPADGLFIAGETLTLDDYAKINEENPFLFCGAKVIEGNGLMLVATLGMDTNLGDLMKQVPPVPDKTLLPRQLDKVNKGTEIFGLSISILIIVVLFIRFMLLKEDVDSNLPELKGKPNAMKETMDAIEKIVMKPNGKISSLATSLSMLLVGVMEGIPFVITLAVSYWNKKILSDRAIAQEPFACLTMSSVTRICIDITSGYRSNIDEVVTEIKALNNYGFNVILVSEDGFSELKDFALEYGLRTHEDLQNYPDEDYRNYPSEERMRTVDTTGLMGDSTPSDYLNLVQHLKDKDHKVAMVGIKTNAIPALKKVDVGITMSTCSTEMARASSDIIIIGDKNLRFLVEIVRCGRCTFENIQKYIQLELTMSIAGLLITSITTMFCGYSPITSIQFLWANFVVALLGGLGLLTEPQAIEQMERLPLRRTELQSRAEPLITKAMCRNIVSQALYQVAMLVTFQFKGQTILGISNEVTKTLIFNSFVMCQVFNQVNAREVKKKNVFKSIHRNPFFGVAVGVNLVLQVAFIEIAHILAGNARLNWVQWFICLLLGMVSWACDWVTKCTIKIKDQPQ